MGKWNGPEGKLVHSNIQPNRSGDACETETRNDIDVVEEKTLNHKGHKEHKEKTGNLFKVKKFLFVFFVPFVVHSVKRFYPFCSDFLFLCSPRWTAMIPVRASSRIP